MTTDRLLKAIVIAGGLAALPISIGGANGIVGTNNAWCSDGQLRRAGRYLLLGTGRTLLS